MPAAISTRLDGLSNMFIPLSIPRLSVLADFLPLRLEAAGTIPYRGWGTGGIGLWSKAGQPFGQHLIAEICAFWRGVNPDSPLLTRPENSLPGISGRRQGRYTPGLGSRGSAPRRGIPAPLLTTPAASRRPLLEQEGNRRIIASQKDKEGQKITLSLRKGRKENKKYHPFLPKEGWQRKPPAVTAMNSRPAQ